MRCIISESKKILPLIVGKLACSSFLGLRVNPVAPLITRMCFNDTVLPADNGLDGLCPLFITKGQMITISMYTLHRDKSF